jgi:outer membrane protein TolC
LFDATVFPAYERGKLQSQSARLDYQSILREVLYGVTAAYYAVLQQERIVAVDKQTVDLAKENLDISEKRSNAGEVTRTDVLRATAALEGDRRTLIESESTLDLNRNRLANILNLDPAKGIEVVEPKETKESLPSFESLLGRAYQKREDLRVQELAIAQDEQRRREVKAGYIPKVSANVSALSGSSSGNGGKNDSSSWEATLSLQVPFFTGGQREIDLKTAQYQINQTRLNYEKFKKTVQEDVRTAWVNVRTLTETIKALQAQVVAADQGYKDLQNQYKAGTATSLDVLDSLKSLNFARKDLAVQTFAYQVALRKVEQVTGVFQEQRIKKVAP